MRIEHKKNSMELYYFGGVVPIAKVFRLGRRKEKTVMVVPAHKEKGQSYEYLEEFDVTTIRAFIRKAMGEDFHIMFLPNFLVPRYQGFKRSN